MSTDHQVTISELSPEDLRLEGVRTDNKISLLVSYSPRCCDYDTPLAVDEFIVFCRQYSLPDLAIQCNCCGMYLSAGGDGLDTCLDVQEMITIRTMGGYGNHTQGDYVSMQFNCCQDCLWRWQKSFVIAPEFREH